MRPIYFTRKDFNDVLNYNDVRAAEFSLCVDGEFIEADAFCSHFTSNTDVVPDSVSPRKVRDYVANARSYAIKVRKAYPFHEAFIDDCVTLSNRHLYGFTPTVVAARDVTVRAAGTDGLPAYVRVFSGDVAGHTTDGVSELVEGEVSCGQRAVFVLYEPNPRLQRELIVRVFRKKVRAASGRVQPVFSLRERKEFLDAVAEGVSVNTLSENDRDLFFHTLMQVWPCGARHRLSSYIFMREGASDIVGKLITWNTKIVSGRVTSISGESMPRSSITNEIARDGVRRTYEFSRSPDADRLVLEGIVGYRRSDKWRYDGWSVAGSPKDPTIVVRSDGVSRWMVHPHGGLESIEALRGGANKAVGGSFIEKTFLSGWADGRVLFAGLGLGVLQRKLLAEHPQTEVVSVERNAGVIDIFEQLYPADFERMEIHEIDFFDFLGSDSRTWTGLVLDFYDPDHDAVREENLVRVQERLEEGGIIVVNKHGATPAFDEKVAKAAARLGLEFSLHELEDDQKVVVLVRSSQSRRVRAVTA